MERELSFVDKTIRRLTCFLSREYNISRLLQKLVNGLVSIETVARKMKRENFLSGELTRVKLPP